MLMAEASANRFCLLGSRNHFYSQANKICFDAISDFTQFLVYITIDRMVASSATSIGVRPLWDKWEKSQEDGGNSAGGGKGGVFGGVVLRGGPKTGENMGNREIFFVYIEFFYDCGLCCGWWMFMFICLFWVDYCGILI